MSLLGLAWRLVRMRAVKSALTVGVVALGTALVLTSVAAADGARGALSAMAVRHPLVVGAEGGAFSLVLGALTGLQDLEAGIDGALAEELQADPRVEQAVPLLGGHEVGGYALLATSADYLQPRERFPLARGRVFEPGLEAVLGSDVAAGLGLDVGDVVTLDHRHAGGPSQATELRVVGVLGATASDADTTVFCPLDAIRASHAEDHHDHGAEPISALLVRPRDDAALLSLQEELDARPGLQVALTGQTLRRLADRLSAGRRVLGMLVTAVALLTALAMMLSVHDSSLAQAREVAVMRVMGARRSHVVAVAVIATGVVIAAGLAAGSGLAAILGGVAEGVLRRDLGLEADVTVFAPPVLTWLAGMTGLLVLVGSQPALAAYSVQAADALAETPGEGRAARTHLRWVPRVAVLALIALWLLRAFGQHEGEVRAVPLDPRSEAVFAALSSWQGGEPPSALAEITAAPVTVEGYMYALGDPFTVQDFYLVAINPRLPRCPFCYRAPTRAERIRVETRGATVDVINGPVSVTGTVRLDVSGDERVRLALDRLDVVIRR
jgi:putative ABC transport system permease protein